MSDLRDYPDFEDVLATLLLSKLELADDQVGGKMPDPENTFGASFPYVRIEELDGQSLELVAYPVMDVDVFARTRREAISLSRSIETLLLGYAHAVKVEGRTVVLGKSSSLRSPNRVDYDDSKVARWGATYQLSTRR